jgi:hypothetical protein
MADRYSGKDVSIYTVAGATLASTGTTFSLDVENDTQEAGLITRLGENEQNVKANGVLAIERSGVISGANRVSHLNVTVFTIGGTDYIGVLNSYQLDGSFRHVMQSGMGEKWQKPQVESKHYKGSLVMDVDTGTALAFANMIGGADFSNTDQAVSITIDGVAITIPMSLQKFGLVAGRYEKQAISLNFNGADPGSGAYPTAPTGTTTILEKAFNAPTSQMAFAFQNALSGNTGGIAASGLCVFQSFSVNSTDGDLVKENYSFLTYDEITFAASS